MDPINFAIGALLISIIGCLQLLKTMTNVQFQGQTVDTTRCEHYSYIPIPKVPND